MPRTLVVGSVHFDIVADFKPETASNLDKIGDLRFSVGGAAYNIAANLARNEVQVALLSVLKEDSLTGYVTANHLEKKGIDCRFLFKMKDIPESGFVAHTCQRTLVSAVSCVAIEHISIPDQQLNKAMHWAEVVAIDTNLSINTIKKVAFKAAELRRPIFACSVSESKVERLFRKFDGEKEVFEVVTMNEAEVAKVGSPIAGLLGGRTAQEQLCKDFSAASVIVTEGIKGYHVFSREAEPQYFKGVDIPNIKSTLGAGDALFAAIVSCFPSSDWMLRSEAISKYLLPVLQTDTAVPGSSTDDHRFSISTNAQQVMGSATFFLVGLMLAALGYFSAQLSYAQTGLLFLVVALLAGTSGGIMSDLIKHARSVLEPKLFLPREGFLGAVAGVIAAILFGLPYLTMNQSGAVNESARLAILKNLMLYDFLFAVVAGLTFQPYLQRIISKTELPDRLDKVESLLQPPTAGGTR